MWLKGLADGAARLVRPLQQRWEKLEQQIHDQLLGPEHDKNRLPISGIATAEQLAAEAAAPDKKAYIAVDETQDIFLFDQPLYSAPTTVGIFVRKQTAFVIKDPSIEQGYRLLAMELKAPEAYPLTGDWNGDGVPGFGLYNPVRGRFLLWNRLELNQEPISLQYGPRSSTWLPIAGDWTGSDHDTLGLYSPEKGIFYLKTRLEQGRADLLINLQPKGEHLVPLAGDWDGDGKDGLGLYDPKTGTFYLKNRLESGACEEKFRFGPKGGVGWPLAGDWNNDGKDTIGVYNRSNGTFFLRNENSKGAPDMVLTFPVVLDQVIPFALPILRESS